MEYGINRIEFVKTQKTVCRANEQTYFSNLY